jgi:succinate-acetate transporter protein
MERRTVEVERRTTEAPAENPATVQARTAFSAGSPVPLGLVAYSIPMFMAGAAVGGWWTHPRVAVLAVVPTLIIFGGIAQFLAGMWAYRTGETLAATFFAVFGAAFGTLGLALRFGVLGAGMWPLGIAAGCLCFVALYIGLGALASNPAVGVTSLALAVALFFAAWSLFAGGLGWANVVAGWAAVVSGGLGLICSSGVAVGSGILRFRNIGPFGLLAHRPLRAQAHRT